MKLSNSQGLSFDFLDQGAIKCIEAGPIRVSLKLSTHFSASGANLWLRKRSNQIEFKPLLGPQSDSRFSIREHGFVAHGHWDGLDYTCTLQLSEMSLSWQLRIDVLNLSGDLVELDLIYAQDVGLKPLADGLVNEHYVSQYLERRILKDETFGDVVCCRQNMNETDGNPWLMMVCKNRAIAGCTDGMQFYGKTFRETGIAEGLLADTLPGEFAGESSILALQEQPFYLAAGDHHQSVFLATFLHDHPLATSGDDLAGIPDLIREFDSLTPSLGAQTMPQPVKNVFTTTSFLPVEELTSEELNHFFGTERRHAEEQDGRLISFFCGEHNHVILRARELMVDRPHAHIMQAAVGFTPDESIMSTTVYAFGVFNSHITQGNTNFNTLLSVCTGPFNLDPESGQRVFVVVAGRRYLLGVPSAFEMGLNHCRWIYKHGAHCFQVRTRTSISHPGITLDLCNLNGNIEGLLITHQFDPLNGWTVANGDSKDEFIVTPEPGSMIAAKFPHAQFRILVNNNGMEYKACGDEGLFADGKPRGESFFVVTADETSGVEISFIGEVCRAAPPLTQKPGSDPWMVDCKEGDALWKKLSLNLTLKGDQADVAAIREILPWYGMNALTHFLTPYGLEQFSGAAWGTRDIAQGPFDLLLSMEQYDAARKVLCVIFSNQDSNGGWPQWWMFDSYHEIRAGSAHGDVVYWCIIALSNYVKVTGDLAILGEELPFYSPNGVEGAEKATLDEHIDRLVKMIVQSFIPGTALVAFGGGDWNDSLQPVSRELAGRMISAWTVEMNYQAFRELQVVYELTGNSRKAEELTEFCNRIKADFNNHLVADGVVAGYGLLEDDGTIGLLLHPTDRKTGIHHSILPMNRGVISGIFTKEQALHHLDLIEQTLKGPEGARLMDRPLKYKGGIQTLFQRAETSTFFGREIGLMYVHEHIRYAEAQARTGRAELFLKALRQAIPVAYRDVVPQGDVRQSNCYYSSSDVIFKNRYEADKLYSEVVAGKTMLKGGWRVYSSGPGIYIGLIITRLLGLRRESGRVIIDPVMPPTLSGLSASITFMGHPVMFTFSMDGRKFGPRTIFINGQPVEFSREVNEYRRGGAVIPLDQFIARLDKQENHIEVL